MAVLAAVSTDEDDELIGTCDALTVVFGRCQGDASEPRIPQVSAWLFPGTRLRAVTDVRDAVLADPASLILVATGDDAIDPDEVRASLDPATTIGVDIDEPGHAMLVGSAVSTDQGRWLGAGAALGLLIVALTATFALGFHLLGLGRRLAVLSVLVDRPGFFWSLAARVVGVPMTVTLALGLVVSLGLALAPTAPGMSGTLPVGAIVVMTGGGLVVVAAVTALGGHSLSRASLRWVARSSD